MSQAYLVLVLSILEPIEPTHMFTTATTESAGYREGKDPPQRKMEIMRSDA